MGTPFEIITDASVGIMRLRIWGYWSTEDAEAYRVAMTQAIAQMAKTRKPWAVLADITKSPAQAATTTRIRQELTTLGFQQGATKIAYVVDSSLTKQQVDRFARNASATACFFHTTSDAMARLKGEPSTAV